MSDTRKGPKHLAFSGDAPRILPPLRPLGRHAAMGPNEVNPFQHFPPPLMPASHTRGMARPPASPAPSEPVEVIL